MNRLLLVLVLPILLAGYAAAADEDVVRAAPDFGWIDAYGKAQSVKSFRGQSLVLLVANSPKNWRFRLQLSQFRSMYERFGAEKILFVAAFTQTPGVVHSNIPFVIAADGPRVGSDYDAGNYYAIYVIGRDGNIDYSSHKVIPGQRVFDIIDNSFSVQSSMRKEE